MGAINRIGALCVTSVLTIGVAAASCNPSTTQGDFWIDGSEATQGVQLTQLVPLIAEKPTYVRVTVRGNPDNNGTLPTVRATLSIVGSSATVAPLNAQTITVPSSNGRSGESVASWSLGDSFVFQLPADATTEGNHQVHVSVSSADGQTAPGSQANRQRDITIQFGPPISLHVIGVRYGYLDAPASYPSTSDWSAFERMTPLVANMMPVSSFTISHYPTPVVEPEPFAKFPCRWNGSICDGYQDAAPWAADLIDRLKPNGGGWIVVLQPEKFGGHHGAERPTAHNNIVINVQEEPSGDYIGLALAHEIGHGLGLCDITASDCRYTRGREGKLGPYVGLRTTPSLATVVGEQPLGTSAAFDLMQNSQEPAWISPYNYCIALANASYGHLTCPGSLDSWRTDYTPAYV
jgi:hypothetical protein